MDGSRLSRSRWAPALAAVPGAVALAVHWALVRPAFVDDSYIFYRYAENWADGLGLVFNRGEDVEGYSSFLWTGMLALERAAGLSLPNAAPVLGLVLGIGCLVVLAYAARALLGSLPLAAAVALAVSLCTGFAFYAANGMDAPLFALVLTGTVALAAAHVEATRTPGRRPARGLTVLLCAALVVLVLARAEGFVYALLLGVTVFGLEWRHARVALAAPIVALVATAIVFAVRQAIYGAWLPATVTAKAYFSHALGQGELGTAGRAVKNGLAYEGVLVLGLLAVVALALALALRARRRLPPLVSLGALVVAVNVTVTVLNSGDWMPHRRLLAPALPLLVLLAAWSGGVLVTRFAPSRIGAAKWVAVGACALAVVAAGIDPNPVSRDRGFVAVGKVLGDTAAPARVLTNVAGVIPYYAGPQTYVWDILGLTDEHNAREGKVFSPRYGRTDPAYDFSRPFDVFVSNAPLDPALMVGEWRRTPGRFRDYVLLGPSPWTAQQLYVFARRGTEVASELIAACGCKPSDLTPRVRSQLVARARAAGALPLE
ncbi:MAG: arabinofuranosyltransferase [Thermoleophilaceae bacterium]|jgi:hypothetical protein|nr:arabinofuranosyltransferase [Thermoleophilaceae bacterium]